MNFDPRNYKVVFFGSSEFSLPILDYLYQAGWRILKVVTLPDQPKGRGLKTQPTPVKTLANKLQLDTFQPEHLKGETTRQLLKDLNADLAVVASYGELIPSDILKTTRKGFVNIHPSKLPKYRGPSPIQFTLLNGETETAATLMVMDEQLDRGPIIAQKNLSVDGRETFLTLQEKTAEAGAELLQTALPAWIMGRHEAIAQDDRRATYTKMFERTDGKIDWKKNAKDIDRQVRALTPWPGTWTTLHMKRYKILEARETKISKLLSPGQILMENNRIFVGCGSGSALEIIKIQAEAKKALSVKEFIKGHHDLQGLIFF
ncbi:MAG: methionyl-tRNA formyltransferase [Candidatus Doudnabacteria bacterium]|nr:methionyl-tRNA formyltransferase [Candidatus Doudnabacteria bacterium]